MDQTNTNSMIMLGLNLLTVALETGADYLRNYSLLIPLIKNELSRHLLQVKFCFFFVIKAGFLCLILGLFFDALEF